MAKSIEFLTDKILRESLLADKGIANLISWSHNAGDIKIGENNLFNVVKRIKVNYEKEGKRQSVNYVAKMNPGRGSEDEFNPYRYRAMLKEEFFYKELLPVLDKELEELGVAPLNVPKCLYTQVDEGREVLIFEDLTERGFVNFPKGNKIDKTHISLMMREITKLHASSITLRKKLGKDLIEVYPLLLESWMVGDPNLRNGFANIFTKGCNFNLNLVNVLPEYKHLTAWLKDLAPKAMDVILDNLKAADPWRIICHADYHKGNVMFRYDSSNNPVEVVIIDWQTLRVVPVASEIQHIAFSSYFLPDREDIITLSEDIYYDELKRIFDRNNISLPFSKEELGREDRSNHFSFLLCFLLIPLSLCVEKPEDLYGSEADQLEKNSEEIYQKILRDNKHLKNILIEYLKEAERRKLHIC